jgi:alpha-galactosidase
MYQLFYSRKNRFVLLFMLIGILLGCGHTKNSDNSTVQINLESRWAFKTGDSLEWKDPDITTAGWDSIVPTKYWESQGYEDYDGYAWYRKTFHLPKSLIEKAFMQDSLVINIATIDDADQVFLNGHLIGQNGTTAPPDSEIGEFEHYPDAFKLVSRYTLPVDDPRIKWGATNVLALRVYDRNGPGGINVVQLSMDRDYIGPRLYVGMKSISEYIYLDSKKEPFLFPHEDSISRKLTLTNHFSETLTGDFKVEIKRVKSNDVVYEEGTSIELLPLKEEIHEYIFKGDYSEEYVANYTFQSDEANEVLKWSEEVPYILTPSPAAGPRINGATVFGVRPGNPVLYKIPVSGERPFQFTAKVLPEGLQMDELNGQISGTLSAEGEYPVTFIVENAYGRDEMDFTFVVGDKLALTPPMGWNSWNCWGLAVDDQKIREAADAIKESGLIDYGWQYINIDDGWEADTRNAQGELLGNEKFPDFHGLCDYVHNQGLKIGIYSSPGPHTCGGHLGSYGHELMDVNTWVDWGIDYLKYDWCGYENIAVDHSLSELKKPYHLMDGILNEAKRDIVYSLCQYGWGDVYTWGNEVGGNLWRTTGDIVDTWSSVSQIGFELQSGLAPYAGPGGWNDPDMMVVGQVGWGPDLHPTRLTPNEQYTHVSLWCLLSAPLLLGNNLAEMTLFTKRLLTNSEVIEVNQDALGEQASRIINEDGFQIWAKNMKDGSLTVGLFNLDDSYRSYDLALDDLDINVPAQIRDLWRQHDEGTFTDGYETDIAPHGVKLIRIFPKE